MVKSIPTSAELRHDNIKHMRWQAKAVANLLSAIHRLAPADQQTTLEATTRLAAELAEDLDALTRGAA